MSMHYDYIVVIVEKVGELSRLFENFWFTSNTRNNSRLPFIPTDKRYADDIFMYFMKPQEEYKSEIYREQIEAMTLAKTNMGGSLH